MADSRKLEEVERTNRKLLQGFHARETSLEDMIEEKTREVEMERREREACVAALKEMAAREVAPGFHIALHDPNAATGARPNVPYDACGINRPFETMHD